MENDPACKSENLTEEMKEELREEIMELRRTKDTAVRANNHSAVKVADARMNNAAQEVCATICVP